MTQQHNSLIEKYLDDELSELQLSEFQQLVEKDEEFRQELNLALELKGMIYCAQHDQYKNLEGAICDELSNSTSELEDMVLAELKSQPVKKSFPVWGYAVAAALVVGFTVLFFTDTFAPPKLIEVAPPKLIEVALLEDFKGQCFVVRGEKKHNLKVGEKLYSGDQLYVQDYSHMTLKYLDGSNIIFLENSFVKLSDLNGKKIVELFSGKLQADITKQQPGKQMEILTEHSKCEVLGTSFTLATSDVSTLLDVTEGEVNFKRKNKSLLVNDLHFAVAGGEEAFEVQKSANPIYKSPLITNATPGRKIPIKVKLNVSKKIYLVVSNGGLNNRFDHAAWIKPRLYGPKGTLDLTKHPWTIAKSGALRITKRRALLVEGVNLKVGISAHATSIIAWDIPEGFDTFEAVGVILDSGALQEDAIPSVNFEVYTSMPEKKLQELLIRRHHY
jgi:hypothetical protein